MVDPIRVDEANPVRPSLLLDDISVTDPTVGVTPTELVGADATAEPDTVIDPDGNVGEDTPRFDGLTTGT